MLENWLVEELTIDPKRIELLREAKKHKGFRITPAIMKKLENSGIDSVLPKKPAFSHAVPTTSGFSEQPKRTQRKRQTEENPKKEQTCAKCRGKLFRVVDNPKEGRRRIIECMRRDCLSTFNLTDLPAGTIIGDYSPNSYLRDPLRMYYPTQEDIQHSLEQFSEEPESLSKNVIESRSGGLFISVPGQSRKAKLM